MPNIIDLDVLRPEPRIIKIGGREIDVSFIPAGITFDLDAVARELVTLDKEKVESDPSEMKHAFMLGVRICSIFCTRKYPDMTEEWFLDNASSDQVTAFANAIQGSLFKVYNEIGEHSKN